MSIRNLTTLTKSEVKGYLISPAAYVFVIIFLLLSGFFTFMMSNFFSAGEASLRSFFFWHPWLYLVLVPAIGMHLWADEKRMGTVELLFTMPITMSEAIISKFLAAWFFVAVALAMTFPMIITVCILGSPDSGAIICGYIGSFLMAGVYLAIAGFTSSFTKSQVVSFIISAIICLFLIIAGWTPVTDMLVEWAPVKFINAVATCSVMPHFHNMQRGIIDLRDVVYFFSMILFFLFLTGIVLKKQTGKLISSILGALFVAGILIMLNALTGAFSGARLDLTDNKIYTLSNASKKIITELNEPITIRFYFSRGNTHMPVQLKNFAIRVEDLLLEYKQAGEGNIHLEKYDPEPFSDAEDSAIMDGVSCQQLSTGDKIYLGISVSCGKKSVAIPFISPAAENMLEYKITTAITEVFRIHRPTIGVMSALPVIGGTPTQEMIKMGIFQTIPSWMIITELKKNFDVIRVPMTANKIANIDLLLIIHPAGISDSAQFAIDQFILKGGNVVAFLDPLSFYAATLEKAKRAKKGKTSSTLDKLLKSWNIQFDTKNVVADTVFARKVKTKLQELNFLTVLDITKE